MNNSSPNSRIIQVIETRFTRGFGIEQDVVRQVIRYFDFEGNMLAEKDDAPSDVDFDARAYVRKSDFEQGFLEHIAHELAASKEYQEYREQYPTLDAEAQSEIDAYMDELVRARTERIKALSEKLNAPNEEDDT